jgi:hypothetical protein
VSGVSSVFHVSVKADGVQTKGDSHFYRGHIAERSDGIRDGIWAEWKWDGNSLTAQNCRYGMMPLYYFHSGDEFCISDSLESLLQEGAPRELDDAAIAVFLRRHNYLGNDTPFKAIRCLPPNSKLTWSNGLFRIESEAFRSSLQQLKRPAIIDAVIELFQQSMSRRLPKSDRFTVPLSGGKDSRQILFELIRQNRTPGFCVTSRHPPPRANGDAEVAAEVARRLKVECRTLEIRTLGLAEEEAKNGTLQFSSVEHQWAVPLSGFLAANVDTSYDGINVDCILYGEKRARLFAEGRFAELAEDFLGDSEAALSRVLKDRAYRRFSREKAIERMIEDLRVHAEQACPVSNYQFWGRTRRLVAPVPFGLMGAVETMHTPFLDRDFFDFVMSLPEAPMVGGHLYKEAIAKCYPEYSDIPYADLGLGAGPKKSYNRRFLGELSLHLAAKGRDTEMIDLSQTLASTVKAAVTGSQSSFEWLQPRLIVYLLQLERFSRDQA